MHPKILITFIGLALSIQSLMAYPKGNPAKFVTIVNLQADEKVYKKIHDALLEREALNHSPSMGQKILDYFNPSSVEEKSPPPSVLFTNGQDPKNLEDNLILGIVNVTDFTSAKMDIATLKKIIRDNKLYALILTHGELLDDSNRITVLENAAPKTFDGWKKTKGTKFYQDLHHNYRIFIKYIEKETGIPVAIISTGEEYKEIIIRQDPFKMKVDPSLYVQ